MKLYIHTEYYMITYSQLGIDQLLNEAQQKPTQLQVSPKKLGNSGFSKPPGIDQLLNETDQKHEDARFIINSKSVAINSPLLLGEQLWFLGSLFFNALLSYISLKQFYFSKYQGQ